MLYGSTYRIVWIFIFIFNFGPSVWFIFFVLTYQKNFFLLRKILAIMIMHMTFNFRGSHYFLYRTIVFLLSLIISTALMAQTFSIMNIINTKNCKKTKNNFLTNSLILYIKGKVLRHLVQN